MILELQTKLDQSLIDYEAQSAQVLSRIDLVKGAKVTIKINKELFDLNRMSINELFRSQEEYIVAARNLVDAVVEKNLSFYRLIANFNQLLNLFGQTV